MLPANFALHLVDSVERERDAGEGTLLTSNCSIILSNATSQTIKLLPVSSETRGRERERMGRVRERVGNCCPNNF